MENFKIGISSIQIEKIVVASFLQPITKNLIAKKNTFSNKNSEQLGIFGTVIP